MKTNVVKPLHLLAASCMLLGGCAAGGIYSEPYALFEAERRMPAADTRPAFIMKIDGVNTQLGRNDPVSPAPAAWR